MIRILVDSSSDYCQEEIREKGLVFVPIQIELAGKEYLDGIDLDKNSFFEMLEESGEFPLTSQPSPQVFLDIFQEVKEQGDDLICILLSSHLSGTYQTAQLARQMADCEDHIFLIDSRAATYNIKVMADYALELVREGLSAAEIAEKLEKFKSRVKVVAMIDTLEYLRRGGRIGKAAAAVGDMARLKPVITVTKEGEIGVVAKALGKNKAVNAILKWVGEHPWTRAFQRILFTVMVRKTARFLRSVFSKRAYGLQSVCRSELQLERISDRELSDWYMWRKNRIPEILFCDDSE